MNNKQTKILIAINLLVILLSISPFLPGPSKLSLITNSFYSLSGLIKLLAIIFIPIGILTILNNEYSNKKGGNITAYLFWTIPISALIASLGITYYLRDFSKEVAIKNCEKIIIAVENYNVQNNNYPKNLSELTPNYIDNIPSPNIMGIECYYYEKNNQSYSIYFTQNYILGFNYEIIFYSPRGEMDIDGELRTIYETSIVNWKYYIYD